MDDIESTGLLKKKETAKKPDAISAQGCRELVVGNECEYEFVCDGEIGGTT